MEKIIWSDKFLTGSLEIDKQHQEFVELINVLIDLHSYSVDTELLMDTTEKLILFIQKHFSDEERILENVQYPGLKDHQYHHNDFIEATADQFTAILNHEEGAIKDLTKTLCSMWAYHMEEEIPEFRSYFSENKLPY